MKYDVKCNVLMTSKPHFDQVCDPHVIKYVIREMIVPNL